MKLGAHPKLDALCGEYVLGTLRGAARKRFERAVAQEPAVARRLQYWEQLIAVKYSEKFIVKPSAAIWQRIRRDLALQRFAPPWYSRMSLWRIWAAAATVALVVALVLPRVPPLPPAQFTTVAVMQGKAAEAQVTVELSSDGSTLRLRSARPVQASPSQSFELWLIPPGGAAPQSLAVVGTLDSRIRIGSAVADRLVRGTKLAVSVEPAGGSPTGGPTGPVIVIGDVQA